MAKPTVYIKGDWNAICDECGQRFRASQLKQRWDGLRVCPKDWETRHPQEFVRAKPDLQTVPWARPESTTYTFPTGGSGTSVSPALGSFTLTTGLIG